MGSGLSPGGTHLTGAGGPRYWVETDSCLISATYPLPKCVLVKPWDFGTHNFYASFGDLSTSYRPISFCVIYASRTQVPHKSHTITIQFLYISYTPWHLYSRHKMPPPCSFCTEWMAWLHRAVRLASGCVQAEGGEAQLPWRQSVLSKCVWLTSTPHQFQEPQLVDDYRQLSDVGPANINWFQQVTLLAWDLPKRTGRTMFDTKSN